MNIKTWTICLYLLLIYWVSQHIPSVKMLFYPTLGAFSYLFISRNFDVKDFSKLIAGASAASLISSALFISNSGFISFFAATISTIILIQKFRLNAPPILAIALVPFFTHPVDVWSLPVAVLVSLSGLLMTLWSVEWATESAAKFRFRSSSRSGSLDRSSNEMNM